MLLLVWVGEAVFDHSTLCRSSRFIDIW